MALTVEDGTGLAGADAYVSLADAAAYHAARGNAAWTGTDPEKEAAVRVATGYLDGRYRRRWKGVRRTQDQALAWPRVGALDEDGWSIAEDSVPVPLVQACAEAALLVRMGTELTPALERGGQIISEAVSVGPISEEKTYASSAPARSVFTKIEDLLSGLVTGGGGSRFIQRA